MGGRNNMDCGKVEEGGMQAGVSDGVEGVSPVEHVPLLLITPAPAGQTYL